MGFRLDRIVIRQLQLPLVHFFETSFSRTYERSIVLVEVVSEGLSGWGEVTAGEHPFYNEEWTASIWPVLTNYVAPRVLHRDFESAAEIYASTEHIRGHFMARGGLEAAVWDLEARRAGVSLAQHIGGGARTHVPCGVSIGIQDSAAQLLEKIQIEVDAGYQRIKIKIKPGWDIDIVRQVRERFAEIPLMADANSAYTLADAAHLKRLDEFKLMMIEQPLAHDDIVDHAILQAQLETPICLDECIRTPHHAEQAIALHACRVLNLKLGRVGGFHAARQIHDFAYAHRIPVWCGGMLESGIGRAHNIALSTFTGFTLPGDVSASKRYWRRDIIAPPVEVSREGTIAVPTAPGFGYDLDMEYLKSVTVREEVIS